MDSFYLSISHCVLEQQETPTTNETHLRTGVEPNSEEAHHVINLKQKHGLIPFVLIFFFFPSSLFTRDHKIFFKIFLSRPI
jgi:hypothetical protein